MQFPRSLFALAAAVLLPGTLLAQSAGRPAPGMVRVALETSAGRMIVALDMRRAPATSANFLAYVDDGRFDNTSFYRASRKKAAPTNGFVQGGIRNDARRILPPFAFEPTNHTGIRHLDGTLSMARRADPRSAGGNFIITVGPAPNLDARPGFQGYAAFGRVVGGMATVRRMLALPTGGGSEEMKGQMILKPVTLIRARRIDGTPRPTGGPKPWLLNLRR